MLWFSSEKLRVGFYQPRIHLLSQNREVFDDLREIGGRDAASQVVTRGVSLLRMRFDLAYPSLAGGGILCSQSVVKAFDHPLVMPLAERDAKAAGAESNVSEGEDAIVSGLEAQIVGRCLPPSGPPANGSLC